MGWGRGTPTFPHKGGGVLEGSDPTSMGPGNRKYTILSQARCQWNDSRSSGGKKETNFPNHLFSDKEQIYKPTLLSIFQQEKVVLGKLITQMLT